MSKQKKLKEQYNTQPAFCQCGYPFPIHNLTIRESFFGIKRIYEEYTGRCAMCNTEYIRVK